MTNWMTAAGLALIAGGLATLIGFRHLLWGDGRRRRAGPQRAIEPSRRMALGATPHVPEARSAEPRRALVPGPAAGEKGRPRERSVDAAQAVDAAEAVGAAQAAEPPRGRRAGRRRVTAAAGPATGPVPEPRAGDEADAVAGSAATGPEESRPARVQGGLARIGLADDEEPSGEMPGAAPDAEPDETEPDDNPMPVEVSDDRADGATGGREVGPPRAEDPPVAAPPAQDLPVAEPPGAAVHAREATMTIHPADLEAVVTPRRPRPDRDGDRVDGWVRPHYRDDDIDLNISGEYWTPAPQGAYDDAGYGWPVPVEKLPAVPPVSGSDVDPGAVVAGPTVAGPQWPPAQPSGRIELPRSWAARDRREGDTGGARPPAIVRRPSRSERRQAATDATELLPSVEETPDAAPRRPRPRPRPSQPERSTVYRSRHAADPS